MTGYADRGRQFRRLGQSDAHPERKASLEGFANFTATSAWFDPDMPDPVYCNEDRCYSAERAADLTSAEQDPLSEERMTQFFWDLRDEGDDAGGEPDGERWTYQEIRNVWSAFPAGNGDTEAAEIDTGVNAWDFTYHWNRKRGVTAGYCDVLDHNEVDQHTRCTSCSSLCP